ncbi:MAG: alanine racemase [Proteobacteria bacterium]|nr:alanine racemase [Pseudomonadota bacterium]
MFTRRKLLLATGGLAAVAAIARPSDKGGAHNDYFAGVNKTLRAAGIDTPVLIIDLDRLDRNVDRVMQSVASDPAKTYRVVAKSIPSPELVDYVAQRADTKALMVFHRPFLQAMARLNPQADILMGKPMPVAAVRTFYASPVGDFDPERQLQWLIDTTDRLNQYLELAKSHGIKMRVNLELDVGLHRGGFIAGEELAQALAIIEANPQQLEFSGFMGYDAHMMGLPQFLADKELPKVKAKYAACVQQLKEGFPDLVRADTCFNGAGSPTLRYYEGDTVVNDLSAGSCLMKPTHYDLPILEDFEPSAFIASPVLKHLQGSRLPALEWTGPLLRGWDQNQTQMFFCYSGNWLAENESPPGLSPHFAYVSSNQQGYSGSDSVELQVDDFIFLRPTQSEAVLLQFGDLVLIRGDQIVDRWPVLPVGV